MTSQEVKDHVGALREAVAVINDRRICVSEVRFQTFEKSLDALVILATLGASFKEEHFKWLDTIEELVGSVSDQRRKDIWTGYGLAMHCVIEPPIKRAAGVVRRTKK